MPSFANPANAREKVDSSGTSPSDSHPHRRRSAEDPLTKEIAARVVGRFQNALRTNALNSASRAQGGRPFPDHLYRENILSSIRSSQIPTKAFCLSSSSPISSSRQEAGEEASLY